MTDRIPVGELLSFVIGGGWGAASPADGLTECTVIRGADIPAAQTGNLSTAPRRYETPKRLAKRTLLPGDLILEVSGGSKDQPTGRTVWVSDSLLGQVSVPVIPASFCRLIRPDHSRVDSRYLAYWLQDMYSAGRTWAYQTQSTGIANFQMAVFEREEIVRLPACPEQQRIAGVLGAFDDLIETNRAIRRSLEALLATVFDREGFDAQPAGSAIALGDVITVNPKEKKPSGEAPYIDMGMLPTDSALIDPPESRPAAGGAKFRNGDTLVARITPCLENGKTAYVSNLPEGSVAVGSTEFIVLRGSEETGDYWPYCLARSPRFRSFAIQQLSDGSSGRQRVAASAVKEYPVPAQDDEAWARFKAIAEPMAHAMVQLHQEELSLTRQRDELLPLLMSGKVRVSEVEGSLP